MYSGRKDRGSKRGTTNWTFRRSLNFDSYLLGVLCTVFFFVCICCICAFFFQSPYKLGTNIKFLAFLCGTNFFLHNTRQSLMIIYAIFFSLNNFRSLLCASWMEEIKSVQLVIIIIINNNDHLFLSPALFVRWQMIFRTFFLINRNLAPEMLAACKSAPLCILNAPGTKYLMEFETHAIFFVRLNVYLCFNNFGMLTVKKDFEQLGFCNGSGL